MTHKRFLAVAATTCMVVLSQAAAARGFNYTYADAGYRNVDSDSVEADAFQADLSFGALENVQVIAGYSRLLIDNVDGNSDVDIDGDEFKLGLGGHFSITDNFDIGATVAYVDDEYTGKISHRNFSDSVDGYEAVAYGRFQAVKSFEVAPRVVYNDVGSSDTTGVGVDLIYDLSRRFSIKGGATYFDDDSRTDLFVGLRINM